MTMTQTIPREATYGWFADAIGGVATAVLAIVGLAGVHSDIMVAIATIVFGAALLIEGGAMMTEYTAVMFPSTGVTAAGEEYLGSNISTVFGAGIVGIALGVLALIGIHPAGLTAISAIVFGCALLFSGNAVWRLHNMRRSAVPRTRSEFLAGEMAHGSMGTQALTGIAAIVLGVLALVLSASGILTLVALLVVGAALLLSGSAASEAFVGFMQPEAGTIRSSPYGAAE
jgi:hypothetical protein